MKSHLIITPTSEMSREQWLAKRVEGLGASETGTIFGLNPYKAEIQLYYEKLDLHPKETVENISMFMGKYQEDTVSDLWQYWERDEETMIANYNAGRIVRRCRKINAYVSNPNFPWIFASLDRIINKGVRGEEGALELKTISSYEADKWVHGIPHPYMLQVQTQIVVCEFAFGELAVLKDGRNFDVMPFEKHEELCQSIIMRTKSFWDKVVEGRKLATQKYEAVMSCNMRLANELQAAIEALEPPPDGSEAYEQFIKDKYKRSLAEIGLIKGSEEDLQLALQHRKIKDDMKKLEENARICENTLKRKIGDGLTLDFGAAGRVSWKGSPKRFYNQVK